jgi:hypothetical protein
MAENMTCEKARNKMLPSDLLRMDNTIKTDPMMQALAPLVLRKPEAKRFSIAPSFLTLQLQPRVRRNTISPHHITGTSFHSSHCTIPAMSISNIQSDSVFPQMNVDQANAHLLLTSVIDDDCSSPSTPIKLSPRSAFGYYREPNTTKQLHF